MAKSSNGFEFYLNPSLDGGKLSSPEEQEDIHKALTKMENDVYSQFVFSTEFGKEMFEKHFQMQQGIYHLNHGKESKLDPIN
jgi:hypothetical protein